MSFFLDSYVHKPITMLAAEKLAFSQFMSQKQFLLVR
jgi:hypothetical protein